MAKLEDLTHGVVDYRQSLRLNRNRTFMVIALFFLIYASLGFLIDLTVNSSRLPNLSLTQISLNLLNFHITPIFTIALLIIAAISLIISYRFYDKLMLLGTTYHEISAESASTLEEKQLYNVVSELKIAAGLNFMPRVFIIEADYMNAFASGYSEKSALVAITSGLMKKLNRDELQAVMAHELSHIKHEDIKLTLTASLLANLSLVAIDVLFYQMLYNTDRRSRNGRTNNLFLVVYFLRILLPFINILLLLYLSRTRELMADAGCVQLTRQNEPLAAALIKIHDDHINNKENQQKAYANTAHENLRFNSYFFDPSQAGIDAIAGPSDLFSTHPSLISRLQALGFKVTPKN